MTPRHDSILQCHDTHYTTCCYSADTCYSSVWDVVPSIPLAPALGLWLSSLPHFALVWIHDPISEALHAVLLLENPDHLHSVRRCMAFGCSLPAMWYGQQPSTVAAFLSTHCHKPYACMNSLLQGDWLSRQRRETGGAFIPLQH